jgi:hypothetical protein
VAGTSAGGSARVSGRWWSLWYPLTIAAVIIAAGVLVWAGSNAILSNTDGALIRTVDDPTQPGFEALVEPTPVMVVVVVADDGSLGSVVVLARIAAGSGGVIVVPPATVVDEAGDDVLAQRWLNGGIDDVVAGVEEILNVGVDESRAVDSAQWEALLTPVGGVTIVNPDTVELADSGNGEPVRFAAGTITVLPNQVGSYLGASAAGESDLNRMVRQQQFWASWFETVGSRSDDPDVLPGESTSGLGLFVRSLGAAQVELVTLPVRTVVGESGDTRFIPAPEQVAQTVALLVPYPVGASPDSRLRVRVLDGTGQLDNGFPAARALVAGGAEIATVGNATRFDYAITQFIVAAEVNDAQVDELRRSLGVGEVVTSAEQASAVDVTVILGVDAIDRVGGSAGGR